VGHGDAARRLGRGAALGERAPGAAPLPLLVREGCREQEGERRAAHRCCLLSGGFVVAGGAVSRIRQLRQLTETVDENAAKARCVLSRAIWAKN
jgi:hypothetical protein